jgi:uroporphyrinogen decarboxylase
MPEAERLSVPHPGERRTGNYLEVVSRLRKLSGDMTVLGGCIGPFSLGARLVGVSEAMELTVNEPELMHLVVRKSAKFLTAYAQAFAQAGAHGLIMAEPAAGLLSPRALAAFSSRYVREIAENLPGDFSLILHNCAAKALHLSAIMETEVKAFHFGAPMDVEAALAKVPADTLICGNLDPTSVFVQSTPDAVTQRTYELLQKTAAHRNFVISSGCDIPPNAPLATLDAFYASVNEHNASHR